MKKHYIVIYVSELATTNPDYNGFVYEARMIGNIGWHDDAGESPVVPAGKLLRYVTGEHYKACKAKRDTIGKYATWGTDAVQDGDGNWSATITLHDAPDDPEG